MKRTPLVAMALLSPALLLLTGCAGGGFGRQSNLTAAGVGQQAPPPTLAQRVGSAFKSAGSALTPKPKVIPADDPINLATQPKQVNPEIHVQMAQLFEKKGDLNSAIGQYQQALRLAPNDLRALLGLARLHDRAEDFANATQTYEQALRAHPNHAVVLNDLGLCYARQGDVPRALDALSKAVDADPGSKLYRNNLGTILIERGHPDEALRHFIIASGEPAANYNVGLLLYKKGESSAAVPYLKRAAQLDPSLEGVQTLLARLDPASSATAYQASAAGYDSRQPAGARWTRQPPTQSPEQQSPVQQSPAQYSPAQQGASQAYAPVAPTATAPASTAVAPPANAEVQMPQMGQYYPYGDAQTPPQPDQYGGSFQPTAFPRHLPPAS